MIYLNASFYILIIIKLPDFLKYKIPSDKYIALQVYDILDWYYIPTLLYYFQIL